MSIPDNYEINVSKEGNHYCRIQLSETFEDKALEKLNALREMFDDEYKLSMTHWICRGEIKDEWK